GDLLARAGTKSSRVIDAADLSDLFGIDMEMQPDVGAAAPPRTPKLPGRGEKAVSAPIVAPAPAVQTARTATALIEGIISQSPKGATVAMLAEATGLPRSKIYAITTRLRRLGRISHLAHGVYGRP
ncbi:MAG TPA: helix-turn-helix domain-containing protein, partial [Desulfoprunum sp.]|nr:helix-turn-helix domain-containing protein [Desulfoprunum sp.]